MKALKHTGTGQMYPYNVDLARRTDMVEVELDDKKPARKAPAKKAPAKKAPAKPAVEPAPAAGAAVADDLLGDLGTGGDEAE